MKKLFLTFVILITCTSVTVAENIEDDSVMKALEKQQPIQTENLDINMQQFSSCQDIEIVMEKYLKSYWKKHNNKGNISYLFGSDNVNQISDTIVKSERENAVDTSEDTVDFSKTNTQVTGVDEADIVKTDGKYIYYFAQNESQKYVYIVSVDEKKVIKKIKLPTESQNADLYIQSGKLSIITTVYARENTRDVYFNSRQKTIVIVYDVSNPSALKFERLYMVNGVYKNSRMIDNYIYLISENYFDFPFYNFEKENDITVDINKIIPTKVDFSYTTNKEQQNYKNTPYNLSVGKVAMCDEIDYILPDKDSLEKLDFSPNYNVISMINIVNSNEKVKTKVIATSNSELYMSGKNMYLTSYLAKQRPFYCPVGARCIMPMYQAGQNTLLHKFSIVKNHIDYQKSTIIPGSPLNQYSMDEYKGDFRILTQTNNWNTSGSDKSTNLYILDSDLILKSKLENLGKGENFKSSRYIGDKLFLVTFQDIDPFFVIDVSDARNPKILGELKIPGYSVYLHPYDDTHIIGLGYNTKSNKWGGIQNSGIKVDLYEINYNKKCGNGELTEDEQKKCDIGEYKGIIAKQKFSKVFGGIGSHSEALYNPRMFMWNSRKNMLFLPVELQDYETKKDYFGGLLSLKIDKDTGIQEKFRTTHFNVEKIENERQSECKQYDIKEEKTCKTLISGKEICGYTDISDIPSYCLADSSIFEYIGRKSWKYRDAKINRALWIGDNFYALSPSRISANDMMSGEEVVSVELQ